jgi:tetratricopeptide (TPR) repeat protein
MVRHLLLGISLAFMTVAAQAAPDTDETKCTADTVFQAQDVIDGCSTVIASGKYTPVQVAEAYLRRGIALNSKREYERAIEDFNASLRMGPKSPTALWFRANAYFGKGDIDRSIADYDDAIKIAPLYGEVYASRAMAYAKKGQRVRAIGDLGLAIKYRPGYAFAYKHRGVFLVSEGQLDPAIDDFVTASRLDPTDFESLNNLCYTRAAANKDLDAALEACDSAMKMKPLGAMHDSRGLVFFRQGEFRKAVAEFDTALAENPKSSDWLYKRGVAKLAAGDKEGGRADIAGALEIDPHAADELASYGIKPSVAD